jgi:hypothetical protein
MSDKSTSQRAEKALRAERPPAIHFKIWQSAPATIMLHSAARIEQRLGEVSGASLSA